MNYRAATIKRKLETLLIFPFVVLGYLAGKIYKIDGKFEYFLFFSSFDIGGAPKINCEIASILPRDQTIIFLSKRAKNDGFKEHFLRLKCKVIDLNRFIDNKYIYFLNFFFRGVLAAWVNKNTHSVVFGGECIFFYKVIPYLKKSIRVVELSHLPTWLNYSQSFVDIIDIRVVSTNYLKKKMEKQYFKNGVPNMYLSNIIFIENWVPPFAIQKREIATLNVLFVGRGAPQKRVHLVSKIAETLIVNYPNDFTFTFIGDVDNYLSDVVKSNSQRIQFVKNSNDLSKHYDRADVLILTSAYEGLPIVVMEMMARGKVVVSTAVNAIPDYIQHKKTGFLIHNYKDEVYICKEGVNVLLMLKENIDLLIEIGSSARTMAIKRFNKETFVKKYSRIFDLKN